MKPDNVVVSILNTLYPDITFIADNGDGVHLQTVFGIVGEVSSRTVGTMRKELYSSDNKYLIAQPKEYTLNIGVQGNRKSNAYDVAEDIQFLLNTFKYKSLFYKQGYAIRVDHSPLQTLPMPMDTGMFLRYQFPIYLTTDVMMKIEEDIIDTVEVEGTLNIEGFGEIKYEETIKED